MAAAMAAPVAMATEAGSNVARNRRSRCRGRTGRRPRRRGHPGTQCLLRMNFGPPIPKGLSQVFLQSIGGGGEGGGDM